MGSISFEEFKKREEKNFGDKFCLIGEFKNLNTKIKLKCMKHNFVFEVLPYSHLRSKTGGCKKCLEELKSKTNHKVQYKYLTQESFIQESKKKFGNKFDYFLCKYAGKTKKVTLKCNDCGNIFDIEARGHLREGRDGGCKTCAVLKVSKMKELTQDEVVKKCQEAGGSEFDYSKIVYKGHDKKIEIVCKKHNESFWMLPSNFYGNRQGCPMCSKSKLERMFKKYCDDNNIEVVWQQPYEDLIDDRKLNYDFYIVSKKILVEIQGPHHFKNVYNLETHKFHKQLHHDWLKRKYARDNNIRLEYIYYWEDIEKAAEKILKS